MEIKVDGSVFKRAAMSFTFLGVMMEQETRLDIQREMGELILKKAKELVPVRTGALKASGRVVMNQSRSGLQVRFGSYYVGYAMVVEYGRMSHAPFAPRPYIRPAVRWAKSQMKMRGGKKAIKSLKAKHLPKRFGKMS